MPTMITTANMVTATTTQAQSAPELRLRICRLRLRPLICDSDGRSDAGGGGILEVLGTLADSGRVVGSGDGASGTLVLLMVWSGSSILFVVEGMSCSAISSLQDNNLNQDNRVPLKSRHLRSRSIEGVQ